MITAVAQTLADLLTKDSPLLSTVQIDLSHPCKRVDVRPALSLYLYDLRKSVDENHANATQRVEKDSETDGSRRQLLYLGRPQDCTVSSTSGDSSLTALPQQVPDGHENKSLQTRNNTSVFWFDLSYIIIPWDWTNLGQQRLLSEVIQLLLSHSTLRENSLAPELQGYGDLSIRVASLIPDVLALWNALNLPLQPALYITIKTPFPIYSDAGLSMCIDSQQQRD